MKKIILLLFGTLLTINFGFAQFPEGKVVVKKLYSELLENPGGENPTRRLSIYLPPGYQESEERYPVIYYLHGFTWSDSLMISIDKFDKLLDKAIALKKIKPAIVVLPDQYTLYKGSWYTNSALTGRWADFTGKDLVTYIDNNFRTIPNKHSRGVAGHSMGGQGALKMGMLFPDVFSVVYALSPGTLGNVPEDFGIRGNGYRRVAELSTREELITGEDEFEANIIVAMGRAYTPNLDNPPFYADLPYEYHNDSLVINYDVLKKWEQKSVIGMVKNHINSLKSLTAIKLDWGRNEDFDHIPITCLQLSKKLENLGINHYAEEYIGDHGNKLWTDDGRAINDMLPFFDQYLKF
ncbi:alpha/beta hydrolase-fold protein [uncultured Zobellia sp.]|uniref:alpha/beta hydrolase n=1 Tax=uncultured Zobellia sp. TaxID=255433 RepID=UPI0025922AB0|nr:alpha/beta hydrolase-fold protein [uncultured Zobellia sp.]